MPIENVQMGEGVRILFPDLVNLYGCAIGKGTTVGPFVEIQKGAIIGEDCIISSHSLICEGVTLGDRVFIGHGVILCNEKHPRAGRKEKWGLKEKDRIVVEDDASIGSGAVILPGVTVGKGAEIGAGMVVTKPVYSGQTVINRFHRTHWVLRDGEAYDESLQG